MNIYQILEPLVEEPIISTIQANVEKTLLSPNEEIRQSNQFGLSITKYEEISIAVNVPKLITPYSTFNMFGSLD
jgi:hypothetical protein